MFPTYIGGSFSTTTIRTCHVMRSFDDTSRIGLRHLLQGQFLLLIDSWQTVAPHIEDRRSKMPGAPTCSFVC